MIGKCLFCSFIREQVRINGFGLFLLLVYPGAFVDLSTEHLQAVSPLRQLRIYCAGVWHNLVVAVAAAVVLMALPTLLFPFYTLGTSVVVTGVMQVWLFKKFNIFSTLLSRFGV